jgi:acetyl-CoA carboxylase carboxyl transferase subunit alpha
LRVPAPKTSARAMQSYLEFEKPVAELEQRIAELRKASASDEVDISAEIARLEAKSSANASTRA